MECYNLVQPTVSAVPVIISSPHSGTFIPPDILHQLKPELAERPDDTDWFVDRLFDFAPAMGVTMITANHPRWVIDLNRNPGKQPLYDDGRIITELVPLTDFKNQPLYIAGIPGPEEIEERLEKYYVPYHTKLIELIQQTKERFGIALLIDAHSVRQLVPAIQPQPFADIIVSDYLQEAASEKISLAALDALRSGKYSVEHNTSFKGGYITRSFGKPAENIHALQFEIVKMNYMDDTEIFYHEERANQLRSLLQLTFTNLISAVTSLHY